VDCGRGSKGRLQGAHPTPTAVQAGEPAPASNLTQLLPVLNCSVHSRFCNLLVCSPRAATFERQLLPRRVYSGSNPTRAGGTDSKPNMGRSEASAKGCNAQGQQAAAKHADPRAVPPAGRSSTASGSEYDADSQGGGSLDYPCSRNSGGGGGRGKHGGGDPDFDEDFLEVDPFDTAVEQLYEKRWAMQRPESLLGCVREPCS